MAARRRHADVVVACVPLASWCEVGRGVAASSCLRTPLAAVAAEAAARSSESRPYRFPWSCSCPLQCHLASRAHDSPRPTRARLRSPTLTNDQITRHFIPSVAMVLNYLKTWDTKYGLPPECMVEQTINDGRPQFAQTFFDQSAFTTTIARMFNWTALPLSVLMPSTCTMESYASGGCALLLDEPVSGTKLQLGLKECPNSYVPYMSLSCSGPWCSSFMRPCAIPGASSPATKCPTSASNTVVTPSPPRTPSQAPHLVATTMAWYVVL